MIPIIKNVYQDLGYNLVALPKTSITPLNLLCKEGDHLSSLECPLEVLFEPDMAPIPSYNTVVADFAGQKIFEFDLRANIGFLNGIFQRFNLDDSNVQLKADSSRKYKVEFSFDQVREDKVSSLDLDNYITGAIPLEKEFRTYIKHLYGSDLFVITSVLKSNTFSINITDESDRKLELDAELKGLNDSNVRISRTKNDGFTISRQNGPELVFAFKAVQILYDKPSLFNFWDRKKAKPRIKNQEGLVLRGEADFPVQLLKPSEFIITDL